MTALEVGEFFLCEELLVLRPFLPLFHQLSVKYGSCVKVRNVCKCDYWKHIHLFGKQMLIKWAIVMTFTCSYWYSVLNHLFFVCLHFGKLAPKKATICNF